MMRQAKFLLAATIAASALTASAQGTVTWLETEHDFGTFSESVGKVTGTMRFVNTGDSALSITRVRPTCGCTAGEFSHQPIMPGDTATITLTYTAIGRPGQFKKDVYVYTSGQPRRTVVSIKGKVIGSVATVSEQYPVAVGALRLDRASIPLGDITRGKTRMAYISAYNTSTDTLAITFGKAPNGLIPQAIPDTIAPGSTATLTMFLDTSEAPLWGLNTFPVAVISAPLHNTGDTACNDVSVMAVVRENFDRLTPKQRAEAGTASIDTDKVDFASMTRASGIVSRELRITNTGHTTLEVRRIYSLQPGVKAQASTQKIKPGKSSLVTISVDPAQIGEDERMLNARLDVITNDPTTPVQTVRLVGLISNQQEK